MIPLPPFNVGAWQRIILLESSEILRFYLNGPTLSRGRGKIAYRPNTFDQDCLRTVGVVLLPIFHSLRVPFLNLMPVEIPNCLYY